MMYTPTNKDSKHIMHLIQKDTIGAEIGVWLGNTSQQFLQKGIKKLYMIDAYSVEPYKDNSEMSYQEYLAKYQHVTGEFAEAGFMRYYDSFEGCYKDLNYALEVVKPSGLILGDDYIWPGAKWGKNGVTAAVNKFKDENNFKLIKHGETQYSMTI